MSPVATSVPVTATASLKERLTETEGCPASGHSNSSAWVPTRAK